MIKFKSQYFKDLDELVAERKYLQTIKSDRDEKERKLREFYNGRPTKTEAEAEETGEDVTNHLFGHARIHAVETALRSTITGKSTFIEIVVDTDNNETDMKAGVCITQKLNKAINHRPVFFNLFQSIAGELPLTGRAALLHRGNAGWCPSLSRGLLVAEDAPPLPGSIPYAYAPRKLTQARLRSMERSPGKFIDVETIKKLLDWSKDKITKKSNIVSRVYGSGHSEDGSSVDEESGDKANSNSTSIDAWEYFEIHHEGSGSYVSSTLYVEEVPNNVTEDTSQETKRSIPAIIVAHDPKAFDSPESWACLILLDAEIGGVKTWDSARSIAELCYPNDSDVETMANASVEGALMRARPRFTSDPGNLDALRKWNLRDDVVVPDYAKEFKLSPESGDLAANMSLLSQNSSNLSSTSHSNGSGGGELRVQALRKGQQDTASTLSRLDCMYRYLQPMCEEMVRRFLVAKIKPGMEGYEDIAWFRSQLEINKLGKDHLKILGSQSFGRFDYITVKIVRSVGEGDVGSQREIAELLMKNIASFAPQVRPIILQMWLALVTNDQDLAERIVTLPNLIISAGRVTAENECDTIMRRASAGFALPTGKDDIDQDHCESHLLDMQALIARHGVVPWNRLDALGFSGLAVHTSEHVQNLMSLTEGRADGKYYAALLQQAVAKAEPILAKLEEEAQQAGVDPEVAADLMLRREELMLRARELGLKERQQDALEFDRDRKHGLGSRKQYAGEVNAAENLEVKRQALKKKVAAKPKKK